MGVETMKYECTIIDPKGHAMIRYRGVNFCLHSTIEDAEFDILWNHPPSMRKNFEILEW
jgi:hypothetical protein